jgi:hypothetical protein
MAQAPFTIENVLKRKKEALFFLKLALRVFIY